MICETYAEGPGDARWKATTRLAVHRVGGAACGDMDIMRIQETGPEPGRSADWETLEVTLSSQPPKTVANRPRSARGNR
jgi:hypothetical protein